MTVDSDPGPLSTEQRKLYDIVTAQYIQELTCNDPPRPLLLNIMALQGLGRRLRSLRRVHGFKSLHNGPEEAIPSSARLQQVLQPLILSGGRYIASFGYL